MNTEQEGPSTVTIPVQEYQSCVGCKWHKHKLKRSGRNPQYDDLCTHPDIMYNNGFAIMHGGREVKNFEWNDRIETPEFCPFLKNDEENSK